MPMFGHARLTRCSPVARPLVPTGRTASSTTTSSCAAEIGQVGTQFDGPGTSATRLKMADGTEHDVYYNGFTGSRDVRPHGLQSSASST